MRGWLQNTKWSGWGRSTITLFVVAVTYVLFRRPRSVASTGSPRSTTLTTGCNPATDMPNEYFFGDDVSVKENVLAISSSYAAYVFERNEEGVWESATTGVACNGEGTLFSVVLPSPHELVVGDDQRDLATIFEKSSSNEWNPQQEIHEGTSQGFTRAMASSGDRLIVGDELESVAYSFVRSSNGKDYRLEQVFNEHREENQFGTRVCICGDKLLIGSLENVFLYGWDGNGGTWKLMDSIYVEFLRSMAMEGDTIVIGRARLSGLAEVYSIDHESSKLVLQSSLRRPLLPEQFGSAVAISGDTVVVGHPPNIYTLVPTGGRAYVYQRTKRGGWSRTQKIRPRESKNGDGFGITMSLYKNETLVIGSPFNERAFVFARRADDGKWVETQMFKHSRN